MRGKTGGQTLLGILLFRSFTIYNEDYSLYPQDIGPHRILQTLHCVASKIAKRAQFGGETHGAVFDNRVLRQKYGIS
jgi:hypothetical protein